MGDIRIGLIGGTGLAQSLDSAGGVRHEISTPFGHPSDAIVETQWAGATVLALARHGPGHRLPPSRVPFRANIFALKELGCTHILASGAVGSLREDIRPRDLVVCDQVIDRTYARPATFFENAAVHVEMAEPFCPVLRQVLIEAARDIAASPAQGAAAQFSVHERGCYVCMEGPAFSTRAESLMHRLWGGDLIGMTAMPEAKLAREAEMPYALVALVTDYDCWRSQPVSADPQGQAQQPSARELLKEIMGNLQAAGANAMRLLKRAVEIIASRRDALPPSPAVGALELAIWSDKSAVAPEEVQRLSPLWIKYFG